MVRTWCRRTVQDMTEPGRPEEPSAAPARGDVPAGAAEDLTVISRGLGEYRPQGLHREGPSRLVIGVTVIAVIVLVVLAAGPLILRSSLPDPQASPSTSAPALTRDAALVAVRSLDPAWQSLAPRDPALIGQSRWIDAAETADGWQVQVYEGTGDCPAGCTSALVRTYLVSAEGAPVLVGTEQRGQ